MRGVILIFLSLFILTGCATSSLNLNKSKELVLDYGSKNKILTNKVIDTKFLNYKDLYVTIYKLQDNKKRTLFYELARTELDFEFNFGGLYTVMYIFDNAQKYNELYRRNNLKLIQLKLKDDSYLNIMIQSSDTQTYSYVYGFCNEEFMKIAQNLKVKEDDKLGKLKYEAITFNNSSNPASNWNDKMVYFTPLITPLRTLGGR